MIAAVVLAAGLGAGSAAGFKAAFPSASVIESPAGGRLTHASGFRASGLGETPEAAARAFLTKYGAAFGIGPRQELIARSTPAPGQPGPVRLERRIDGLPVFDGDVVVGVDASNAVILVNNTDTPPRQAGRARISRSAAIRAAKAAIPGLRISDAPRVERGWRGAGQAMRPVWRVDFVAERPPGDWRTYVDAATGKVLLRTNLRADSARLGAAPSR